MSSRDEREQSSNINTFLERERQNWTAGGWKCSETYNTILETYNTILAIGKALEMITHWSPHSPSPFPRVVILGS